MLGSILTPPCRLDVAVAFRLLRELDTDALSLIAGLLLRIEGLGTSIFHLFPMARRSRLLLLDGPGCILLIPATIF